MKHLRLLPAAALLAVSANAAAANFSYDYLEGGFGELDQADALYLSGAFSLDKAYGLQGSAGFIDYDGGDGKVLRFGGFYRNALQRDLDLFLNLELVYSDFKVALPPPAGTWNDSDIGFSAGAGLRFAVQDNFHVEGKLTLTEVDPFDDGLGFSVNARYYMDKRLSAAIGLASDTEFDGPLRPRLRQ